MIVLENVTLQSIRGWLKENGFKKRNSKQKEFTLPDVWMYVRRGHLPRYMGNYVIKEKSLPYTNKKLYTIINEKSS